MENPAVKWGLYLGIASIASLLIFYIANPELIFSYNSYLGFVLTIIFLVMACKEQRTNLGGYSAFGEMFKTAFITFLIGSIIGIVFQYIFMNFVDPGLIEMHREISMEAVEKMGSFIGEEGMEAAREKIEESNPVSIGNMGIGFLFSLVIGAIFAAIIGAIMKKTDPAQY